jgi:hypothetical protein
VNDFQAFVICKILAFLKLSSYLLFLEAKVDAETHLLFNFGIFGLQKVKVIFRRINILSNIFLRFPFYLKQIFFYDKLMYSFTKSFLLSMQLLLFQ